MKTFLIGILLKLIEKVNGSFIIFLLNLKKTGNRFNEGSKNIKRFSDYVGY